MTLHLRPDVSTAHTENGLVLLDERTGRYWQLNPSGACTFTSLIDGGTEHAIQALVERFGISVDQASADVAALEDALRQAGLVTA